MAKLSNQRVQIGSTSYLISSGATSAKPSVHVNRSGNIEITFNRGAKPSSGHSDRHDERVPSSSTRYPRPPRSDVATIGSSTYLRAPTHAGNSHSESHHKSSSPGHQTRAVSRSPDTSRRLLDASNTANDRQHHHKTSPRVERINIPSSSPQKHAHFVLPHSMPNQSNLVERIASQQPSRHRYTHSHESYFRHRPQGWYNRRGDQFIQRGVIKRQPQHLEWDVIFAKYPEPGTGWMDAEGHYLPPTGGILKH